MPSTASAMPAACRAVMMSPRNSQPPSSTRMVLLCPSTCVCQIQIVLEVSVLRSQLGICLIVSQGFTSARLPKLSESVYAPHAPVAPGLLGRAVTQEGALYLLTRHASQIRRCRLPCMHLHAYGRMP